MLVSHRYQFIFLKAKKVSGTSTEAFLERYCLSPEEEQTHIHTHSRDQYVSEHGIIGSRLKNPNDNWHGHKLPLEIRKEIGEEKWNGYKKICNIRNPFDIPVSLYFQKQRAGEVFYPSKTDFNIFLKNNMSTFLDNYIFWKPDGSFSCDHYIRQENLNEDMQKLITDLGLPDYNQELPEYKITKDRKHYSEYYNNESRKVIETNFQDILNKFNYQF